MRESIKSQTLDRTKDLLEQLVRSGSTEKWFEEETSKEEATSIRYNFHKFIGEFVINYSPKDFVGYYVIYPEQRAIEGLYPLSLKEFLLFVCYAACLIFTRPHISLTKDFVKKIGIFYNLDLDGVNQFCKEVFP